MKSRLIVSAIGIPLLILLIFAAPTWVIGLTAAAVSLFMISEIWKVFGGEHKTLEILTAFFAIIACVFAFFGSMTRFFEVVAVYFICAAVYGVFSYENSGKGCFGYISLGVFSITVLSGFMMSLARTSDMEYGRFYTMFIFVVCFAGDSGALFAGKLFGKHKLCPRVSPNKTVEGAVGGFVSSVVASVIYVFVVRAFGAEADITFFVLYGIFGNIFSQFGDLFFSLVKREHGVKDYGSILPGHGGMLDRLDSVLFAAAVLDIMLAAAA